MKWFCVLGDSLLLLCDDCLLSCIDHFRDGKLSIRNWSVSLLLHSSIELLFPDRDLQ